MFKKILAGACLALSLGTATQAATVTTYTSEAAYDGAVGAQEFIIDFNGLPSGVVDGNFVGQVNFNTPQASTPDNVIFGSSAMTDAGSTTSANRVGVLQGVLANDAYAMSMTILSGSIEGFKLFDDGSEIATVNISGSGFFGLSSDMVFDTFELIPRVVPTIGNDRVFIDDFEVNAAPPVVPAPPALALLGTGVFAFGALRRRKPKAQRA